MDKETLSNYGWIVICVLVLAVMLALATPFGQFISDAVWNTANGLFDTNNNALDNVLGDLGVVPTPEQLQAKHKFEYYSTLNGAVNDVNNGTVGDNADVNKENAVAGIYTDENGGVNVVLLKDTTEATTINPTVDMTINLGGHVLSSTNTIGLNITVGNVAIDGRLNGSTIQLNHTQSTKARTIVVDTGANLTVDSGTYVCKTEGDNSICINSKGNLTLTNATVIGAETTGQIRTIQVLGDKTTITNCSVTATSNEGAVMGTAVGGPTTISDCSIIAATKNGKAHGVYTWAQANNATITNCSISTTATDGKAYGMSNYCTAVVSDSTITAYSNYGDDGNGRYLAIATGFTNVGGTATLNDCYIMGTHSGVQNTGTLYVNGGNYEGYGHGGFYFGGAGTISYVRNATIRERAMPDGYLDLDIANDKGTTMCNGAGFYIGGADNMTVYMDNCNIYGSRNPIVLRDTSNEQNNNLYISNSRINKDYTSIGVRIDNDTHKLYIGTGNNFTADNTNRTSAVIQTNETYTID